MPKKGYQHGTEKFQFSEAYVDQETKKKIDEHLSIIKFQPKICKAPKLIFPCFQNRGASKK